MFGCPDGCVKESQMVFWNNNYTCPKCKIKGKWHGKRKPGSDGKLILNDKGHTYVVWEDGRETVNNTS